MFAIGFAVTHTDRSVPGASAGTGEGVKFLYLLDLYEVDLQNVTRNKDCPKLKGPNPTNFQKINVSLAVQVGVP